MTTVRFLMRWFHNKSAQTKLRADVALRVAAKPQQVAATKSKPEELKIKWGNPVRWYF